MKITIHEAECNVGYARPIFRSMNRDEVVKEIADGCREAWSENNWGDEDDPPPIPESDEEVIRVYFWADDEIEEGPWIAWSPFKIDIGAPAWECVDLTVDGDSHFMVMHDGDGGGSTFGRLMGDTDGEFAVDVIEGFILALTTAGFPVHLPEFKTTLANYLDVVANEMD